MNFEDFRGGMRKVLVAAAIALASILGAADGHADWKPLGNLSQPLFKKVKLSCSQRLSVDGGKIALPFATSNRDLVAISLGSGRSHYFEIELTSIGNEVSSTGYALGINGVTNGCADWEAETGAKVRHTIVTFQIGADGENTISLSCESGTDAGGTMTYAEDKVLKHLILEQSC